jgi:alpha-galactosidase
MDAMRRTLLLAALLAHSFADSAGAAQGGKLRVFVLAGQSNMEGKGFPEPLAWQVTQPQYRERYTAYIEDGDHEAFTRALAASLAEDPARPEYRWSVREDVFIDFLGKRGGLSVGYGVPSKGFGPELGFGHVVGDHLDDPVLIIKAAWGGKSLGCDFLSPSAQQPAREELEAIAAQETERARQRAEQDGKEPGPPVTVDAVRERYGHYYRETLRLVHENLTELDTRFPELRGRTPELAGFVWFQGWNDQFNPEWSARYAANLAALIADIRKDLGAPELPVVVGQVGFDGENEPRSDEHGAPTARTWIQQAQLAAGELDGVVVVQTAQYWDRDAHAIYHGPGGWQADVEKWRQFGNDRPYHYLGSPWFFSQAGRGFGEALLALSK